MQFRVAATVIFLQACLNDFVKVARLFWGDRIRDDLLATLCLEKLQRASVSKAALNECAV